MAPIWFSAQWTFNLSLSRTTVSSNTILSATASLFTYGLALLILNDTFTWLKLASVLTCILGPPLPPPFPPFPPKSAANAPPPLPRPWPVFFF